MVCMINLYHVYTWTYINLSLRAKIYSGIQKTVIQCFLCFRLSFRARKESCKQIDKSLLLCTSILMERKKDREGTKK
jgi:hypothetical protein